VILTRAAHQSEGLAALFAEAGFTVAFLPLLEVIPPADPSALAATIAGLARFDWLVLTSVNTVAALVPHLPAVLPPGLRVAAVGTATARAARAAGLPEPVIAEEARAEGLLALFHGATGGARVLLPQAADARPLLADGLTAGGARVTAVAAYDKALPAGAVERARALFSAAPMGWVTVTSPRIARHLVEVAAAALEERWPERRGELQVVSIGPVTSAALRRLGVPPAAEAPEASDPGLVAAVTAAARRGGGGESR
jgi:uroporphyrinogen-III synthase